LYSISVFLVAYLANVNVCYMSSSICLLSVMFVHPTQLVVISGNVSMPFCTTAIHWHLQKILWRSSQGNPSIWGVKCKRGSQI